MSDNTPELGDIEWRHLDGTECVAGWDAATGECVEGGGLVTPRVRTASNFVEFGARVIDSGGGWVNLVVDEDTEAYPPIDSHVRVQPYGENAS